jgi:prephenate dehydrogenase
MSEPIKINELIGAGEGNSLKAKTKAKRLKLVQCGDLKPVLKQASRQASLESLRKQIDSLDEKLVSVLVERLNLARQIGRLKGDSGLAVKDKTRELAVLNKVAGLACCKSENSAEIVSVYKAILEASCNLQEELIEQKQEMQKPLSGISENGVSIRLVVFVGLGLIGGALARQIRQKQPQIVISAIDNENTIDQAMAQQVIDGGSSSMDIQLLQSADLIVLAAPPEQNIQLLEQLSVHLRAPQIVIDISSTKESICDLASKLDLNGAGFVGGHPLFGSEKKGFTASAELNCQDQTFALTPQPDTDIAMLSAVIEFLQTIGLKVVIAGDKEHDQVLAVHSHLIQLMAVALGNTMLDLNTQARLDLSGTSFKQIARLMNSPFSLWSEIVSQNRKHILNALERMEANLGELKSSVELGEVKQLEEQFLRCNKVLE